MSNKFLLCTLIISGIITIFEADLLLSNTSFANKMVLHLLLVVPLLGLVCYLEKKGYDNKFLILLTLCFGVMGPFGSAMCLVGIMLYALPLSADTSEELFKMVLPSFNQDDSTVLYERLLYGFEMQKSLIAPTSFADIITYGSLYQKRLVIEKILRYFKPAFTPILRKALRDSSAVIRTLAATAIVAIDDRFLRKNNFLEDKVKENPTETNLLLLARFCAFYFYSNVTDQDRKKKIGNMAIAAFEKYHEVKPNDPSVLLSLGKLYYLSEDLVKSQSCLEKFLEYFPENYEANQWYMRILYEKKEYENVRKHSLKKLWKTDVKI